MSLITSATTYDYESVSYLHEEKQRMFVWGRNIYLVQLLSAATPGMTSPVRKRVPVGQICNRLQAQMDSETGTTSTPLSPKADTVDSRYLAPVGSQNSRARVRWFSRYLALSREGHDSRIQDHRPTLPAAGVYNSNSMLSDNTGSQTHTPSGRRLQLKQYVER